MNYCRGAVIFPHNIGLGAANDADIMYEIGAATADEAKLAGMLWNFAPCVAVSTDPRWGRTYESCSSDPEIVGNLGTAYVRGLGDNGYLIDRGDANLNEEEIDELLGVYKKLIDAGVPKETCIRFTSRTIKYDTTNGRRIKEDGMTPRMKVTKRRGFRISPLLWSRLLSKQ